MSLLSYLNANKAKFIRYLFLFRDRCSGNNTGKQCAIAKSFVYFEFLESM